MCTQDSLVPPPNEPLVGLAMDDDGDPIAEVVAAIMGPITDLLGQIATM